MKIRMRGAANMNTAADIMRLKMPLITKAVLVPRRILSCSPAPKFCATKVE